MIDGLFPARQIEPRKMQKWSVRCFASDLIQGMDAFGVPIHTVGRATAG